jgi:hypothetical protein
VAVLVPPLEVSQVHQCESEQGFYRSLAPIYAKALLNSLGHSGGLPRPEGLILSLFIMPPYDFLINGQTTFFRLLFSQRGRSRESLGFSLVASVSGSLVEKIGDMT